MTGPPFSPDDLSDITDPALQLPGADGVEILFTGSNIGLTRYANSQIIQNTVQSVVRAYVRVAKGKRFAVASTNRWDGQGLHAAAKRALEAARQSADDPDFPGLPDPAEVGTATPIMKFDEMTAAASPAGRADAVGAILKATRGFEAAGIYETGAHAYAVKSSTGINCFDAYTRCVMNLVVESNGSSGYREASSHRQDAVDVEGLARSAAVRLGSSVRVRQVEPGRYDVVLEPGAVAILLEYLSYMGMGGKQLLDGESFLSSRLGQMVAEPSVTVADDVRHPRSLGIGFDLEGVPKTRVAVIDGGRASRPVTDLRTSKLLSAPLSGHYSGSNEFGPYAANVVMEPGDLSSEDLIGGVDDGLLITRLHYVNVLDRPEALLTGMTRDGVWRIRGGEVTEPATNLRFTQSVLDVLKSVAGIGRDVEAFAPDYGSFGSNVAPALRCTDFNFTSATSH